KRRVDEGPKERGFLGVWLAESCEDMMVFEDWKNPVESGEYKILSECPKCGSPASNPPQKGEIFCESCNLNLKGSHILPLRFHLKRHWVFTRYLDDNLAYIDVTDRGRLSTLIFRKIAGAGRERSAAVILPEETEKVKRLLERVQNEAKNDMIPAVGITPTPLACKSGNRVDIRQYLDFSKKFIFAEGNQSVNGYLYKDDGSLRFETILEFWLINELASAHENLTEILGLQEGEEIEWFANQILFGIGGEKSDVLVLIKNSDGLRHRAVLIELKRDKVKRDTFDQMRGYAYWIAQLVSANLRDRVASPFTITPIAIGESAALDLSGVTLNGESLEIPYDTPLKVKVQSPAVWKYEVNSSGLRLKRC
ncbi:MAG: hypothetical protein ABIM88_08880, partial [candidate division WOR-3 bacterium]